MKILMLTPYLPYPLLSGGQIRTYNLLKKLSTKHEITLFALIKEDKERKYISELKKYCVDVQVFNRSCRPFTLKNVMTAMVSSYPFLVIRNYVPQTIQAIQKELKTNHYDLIHAETFYMMPHLPKTNIPTILVEQTIEYLGYESYAKKAPFFVKPLLNNDINKIKKWERFYWEKCDRLIVMSDDDKSYIGKQIKNPQKIAVVANGVDIQWFDEVSRALPKQATLLSVGTFKWLPNIEAVNFLVKKIWPILIKARPDLRLLIVGNDPTPDVMAFCQRDARITILGRIPDIRQAFKSAHVLIAPVFSGKGTRYKILEAMASGTPVVASTIAVEGLQIENRVHVLTENTAEGLAKLTLEVLNDPKLWQRLSENGYKFVSKYYNWNVISKKLDTVYQEFAHESNN